MWTYVVGVEPVRAGVAVLQPVFGDRPVVVHLPELQLGHSGGAEEVHLEEGLVRSQAEGRGPT